MAAIPVEVAVLVGVSVGGTVISSAVAGIVAWRANSKLGHSKKKLSNTLELRAGHHISYRICGSFVGSVQHAIIIQQYDGDRWELVFLTGSEGTAHISCEEVDLGPYLPTLYLHNYNPVISYAEEDIVKRATSLAIEYNDPAQHSAIRDYWAFFKDGENFTVWCQTGVSFFAVLHGMFSSDYKFTVVRNVLSLREGDHVCYKIGVGKYAHGIVAGVDKDRAELTLVSFSNRPIRQNFHAQQSIRTGQFWKYDYDMEIHNDNVGALAQALAEINIVRGNSYTNSEQFAVWCKTGSCDNSPEEISTFAKARAVGRVHTLVQSRTMLKVGDHITYKPGAVFYQHAIVVAIEISRNEMKLDIVKLPRDVDEDENWRIVRETINSDDAAKYIQKEQLFKYFYDVRGLNAESHADLVVTRAVDKVGVAVWQTPFKDSLHFAVWCETGAH